MIKMQLLILKMGSSLEKLLEEDAKNYELTAEEIRKLKLEEPLVDEKLNRLLDTYLDQVIDKVKN